ncbi:MAG: HepT-like ribonuclease domain-containing protein [Acidimicrobiales bacterium]
MSRGEGARLADIAGAIDAIRSHLARGSLDDGLIYDAVRARLIEIGEAVKALDDQLVAKEPTIEWSAIARLRDHLAHHYFNTDHAIVNDIVDNELASSGRGAAPRRPRRGPRVAALCQTSVKRTATNGRESARMNVDSCT